jgi:hypothetical protein
MGRSVDKLVHAARFEAFYNAHYLGISGYVRRRVPDHEAPTLSLEYSRSPGDASS